MAGEDNLAAASRLFQMAQDDQPRESIPSAPCGRPCIPLILHAQDISSIKKRLEAGDRALDAIPLLVEEMKAIRANSDTMMKDVATTKADIATTKVDIAATKDVVEAWGRMVGAAKVMSGLSTAIKVATPIVLFIGFLYLVVIDPQSAVAKARLWLGFKGV